jgi:hypothetical protein
MSSDDARPTGSAAGAIPVLLVDDAAATRSSLLAGGVSSSAIFNDVCGRHFIIDDPDGNRLELMEPLRKAAEPRDHADAHQVASDMTVAFSADQPGTLARALEALTQAGLDTGGYAEIEGFFHLLVSKPGAARVAFEQAGFRVEGDQPVVVVDVDNFPGSTAALFREVADAGVNVAFTYASADGRLVIGTREVDRLMAVLGGAAVRDKVVTD